jgi:hypothetical protein
MQIQRKLTESDIEHMEAVVRDSPDEKLRATLAEVKAVYTMSMMLGIDDMREDAIKVMEMCRNELIRRHEWREKAKLN